MVNFNLCSLDDKSASQLRWSTCFVNIWDASSSLIDFPWALCFHSWFLRVQRQNLASTVHRRNMQVTKNTSVSSRELVVITKRRLHTVYNDVASEGKTLSVRRRKGRKPLRNKVIPSCLELSCKNAQKFSRQGDGTSSGKNGHCYCMVQNTVGYRMAEKHQRTISWPAESTVVIHIPNLEWAMALILQTAVVGDQSCVSQSKSW